VEQDERRTWRLDVDVNTPLVAMVTTTFISQTRVVTMVMHSNGTDEQRAVANGNLQTNSQSELKGCS